MTIPVLMQNGAIVLARDIRPGWDTQIIVNGHDEFNYYVAHYKGKQRRDEVMAEIVRHLENVGVQYEEEEAACSGNKGNRTYLVFYQFPKE